MEAILEEEKIKNYSIPLWLWLIYVINIQGPEIWKQLLEQNHIADYNMVVCWFS